MKVPQTSVLGTVALCLLAVLTTACVAVRSEMLVDTSFPARPEDYPIPHYGAGAELSRPYIKIAVVRGHGAQAASWDKVLESLKDEARRLGADALILIDQHTEVDGSTSYLQTQHQSYAQGHVDHHMNYGESYAYGQSDGYVYGESTGQAFGSTSVSRSKHASAYAIRWKDGT